MASLATRALDRLAEGREYDSINALLRDVADHNESIHPPSLEVAVRSLARDGKVYLREGGDGRLTLIKATKLGYRDRGQPIRPVAAQVGHATGMPSNRPGDMTDFRNHHSRAEGGDITVTHVTPVVRGEDHMAKMRAGDGSATRERVAAMPDRLAREILPLLAQEPMTGTQVGDLLHLSKTPTATRIAKAIQLGWVARVRYQLILTDAGRRELRNMAPQPTTASPTAPTPPTNTPRQYPLLAELMDRHRASEKLLVAAEALMVAGKDEMADTLLREANLSDLEQEMVAYMKASEG